MYRNQTISLHSTEIEKVVCVLSFFETKFIDENQKTYLLSKFRFFRSNVLKTVGNFRGIFWI